MGPRSDGPNIVGPMLASYSMILECVLVDAKGMVLPEHCKMLLGPLIE